MATPIAIYELSDTRTDRLAGASGVGEGALFLFLFGSAATEEHIVTDVGATTDIILFG